MPLEAKNAKSLDQQTNTKDKQKEEPPTEVATKEESHPKHGIEVKITTNGVTNVGKIGHFIVDCLHKKKSVKASHVCTID